MKREPALLSEHVYDVVVIGGGAFGVCAAWDAALRGLSVALLEKNDFSHATSANHFKMVHGGIRYLQHGDFTRLRESCCERRAFLRIAPHLIRPLPIAIPTYGHGRQGKALMAAGFRLYDALTWDRNRGIRDRTRHIPSGRLLSRQDCLAHFPQLDTRRLTGAALFYDAQMYNPPRLAMSFLHSAVERGAHIANYVTAVGLLSDGKRVYGVKARDECSGECFDVRAKVVLNAAGPWAGQFLRDSLNLQLQSPLTFSRDACFLVKRRLVEDYALAIQGQTKDPDSLIGRQHRHLFLVPWRDVTLVGVWHVVHQGAPEDFTVTETELQTFIDEVNAGYPAASLKLDDVVMWNAGLVLFGDNDPGTTHLRYGHRSYLIDHARSHSLDGLVTLIGVRATTARGMAAQAIDIILDKLGISGRRCQSDVQAIFGGDIDDFTAFEAQALRQANGLPAAAMRALVRNYGTQYPRILSFLQIDPALGEPLGASTTLKAEVIHAVREEMARNLGDVVFRRTELGTAGHPGDEALCTCAELMGKELGWGKQRIHTELAAVRSAFPAFAQPLSPVP